MRSAARVQRKTPLAAGTAAAQAASTVKKAVTAASPAATTTVAQAQQAAAPEPTAAVPLTTPLGVFLSSTSAAKQPRAVAGQSSSGSHQRRLQTLRRASSFFAKKNDDGDRDRAAMLAAEAAEVRRLLHPHAVSAEKGTTNSNDEDGTTTRRRTVARARALRVIRTATDWEGALRLAALVGDFSSSFSLAGEEGVGGSGSSSSTSTVASSAGGCLLATVERVACTIGPMERTQLGCLLMQAGKYDEAEALLLSSRNQQKKRGERGGRSTTGTFATPRQARRVLWLVRRMARRLAEAGDAEGLTRTAAVLRKQLQRDKQPDSSRSHRHSSAQQKHRWLPTAVRSAALASVLRASLSISIGNHDDASSTSAAGSVAADAAKRALMEEELAVISTPSPDAAAASGRIARSDGDALAAVHMQDDDDFLARQLLLPSRRRGSSSLSWWRRTQKNQCAAVSDRIDSLLFLGGGADWSAGPSPTATAMGSGGMMTMRLPPRLLARYRLLALMANDTGLLDKIETLRGHETNTTTKRAVAEAAFLPAAAGTRQVELLGHLALRMFLDRRHHRKNKVMCTQSSGGGCDRVAAAAEEAAVGSELLLAAMLRAGMHRCVGLLLHGGGSKDVGRRRRGVLRRAISILASPSSTVRSAAAAGRGGSGGHAVPLPRLPLSVLEAAQGMGPGRLAQLIQDDEEQPFFEANIRTTTVLDAVTGSAAALLTSSSAIAAAASPPPGDLSLLASAAKQVTHLTMFNTAKSALRAAENLRHGSKSTANSEGSQDGGSGGVLPRHRILVAAAALRSGGVKEGIVHTLIEQQQQLVDGTHQQEDVECKLAAAAAGGGGAAEAPNAATNARWWEMDVARILADNDYHSHHQQHKLRRNDRTDPSPRCASTASAVPAPPPRCCSLSALSSLWAIANNCHAVGSEQQQPHREAATTVPIDDGVKSDCAATATAAATASAIATTQPNGDDDDDALAAEQSPALVPLQLATRVFIASGEARRRLLLTSSSAYSSNTAAAAAAAAVAHNPLASTGDAEIPRRTAAQLLLSDDEVSFCSAATDTEREIPGGRRQHPLHPSTVHKGRLAELINVASVCGDRRAMRALLLVAADASGSERLRSRVKTLLAVEANHSN